MASALAKVLQCPCLGANRSKNHFLCRSQRGADCWGQHPDGLRTRSCRRRLDRRAAPRPALPNAGAGQSDRAQHHSAQSAVRPAVPAVGAESSAGRVTFRQRIRRRSRRGLLFRSYGDVRLLHVAWGRVRRTQIRTDRIILSIRSLIGCAPSVFGPRVTRPASRWSFWPILTTSHTPWNWRGRPAKITSLACFKIWVLPPSWPCWNAVTWWRLWRPEVPFPT